MTYTYAILRVSPVVYDEIRAKLADAGYDDQFHEGDDGPLIDMHGIALQAEPAPPPDAPREGGKR